MIRFFIETTSAAPVEKVFDAYLSCTTAQKIVPEITAVEPLKGGEEPASGSVYAVKENHRGRLIEYEAEFLTVAPFSAARGVTKSKSYTTTFEVIFSATGREVKIESLQELQMRSAWWWFGQPLMAMSSKEFLRRRVGLINKYLDGERAAKVKVKAYIGRWPLWSVMLTLWLALVFGSAALFQFLGVKG